MQYRGPLHRNPLVTSYWFQPSRLGRRFARNSMLLILPMIDIALQREGEPIPSGLIIEMVTRPVYGPADWVAKQEGRASWRWPVSIAIRSDADFIATWRAAHPMTPAEAEAYYARRRRFWRGLRLRLASLALWLFGIWAIQFSGYAIGKMEHPPYWLMSVIAVVGGWMIQGSDTVARKI